MRWPRAQTERRHRPMSSHSASQMATRVFTLTVLSSLYSRRYTSLVGRPELGCAPLRRFGRALLLQSLLALAVAGAVLLGLWFMGSALHHWLRLRLARGVLVCPHWWIVDKKATVRTEWERQSRRLTRTRRCIAEILASARYGWSTRWSGAHGRARRMGGDGRAAVHGQGWRGV